MKVLIGGDFCPSYRIRECLLSNKIVESLDYLNCLSKQSDLTIVNLECPVIENDKSFPLLNLRPSLSTSIDALFALKESGVNLVTLANNHIRDHSNYGVLNTIKQLDGINILHVGAGVNIEEARKVRYINLQGHKLAVVNFCEHEFSIASSEQAGAAPLEAVANYYQIEEAKNNADFVLVIVHGGHEHYQYPSPRMKKNYRWLIDLGASAVVNHHQHCVNGYEVYKGRPIFYGIGNLCFDHPYKRNSLWNEGMMVMLNMDKDISFQCFPYYQCDETPTIRPMKQEEQVLFFERLKGLSEIIIDDDKLEQKFIEFIKNKSTVISMPLSPYSNRYLISAYIRHLLPSFLTKKRVMYLYDFINCESHRDILLSYLYNRLFL